VADYQQAIKKLLASNQGVTTNAHWSPDLEVYFHQSLSDAMDKSTQYVLNSLGIQSDGIANNCSESFNAVLKAKVGWKNVQTNALREVLRGHCNLGNCVCVLSGV
jgi:hypothetical protein